MYFLNLRKDERILWEGARVAITLSENYVGYINTWKEYIRFGNIDYHNENELFFEFYWKKD